MKCSLNNGMQRHDGINYSHDITMTLLISKWRPSEIHISCFFVQQALKFCCDYMLNFSPRAKRKFPWENLLRCENMIDAHAHIPFSARAKKMIG